MTWMKRTMHAGATALSSTVLAVMLFANSATAQVSASEEKALRTEQAALFAEMFEKPDDLDLMFKYALTSIRLLDFEAAISTLERILIFNSDLPRVRLELGASYFRIGSYPVARHYFQDVAADQTASADLKARAARFLAEIDNRTQTSSFSGVFSLNALFSTNANNGPGSAEFVINGQAVDAIQGDDQAQTDIGGSITGVVSHRYDLGGPDEDFWRTDLAFVTTRFAETDAGSVDVAVLRSGPRLSIDDDRYGMKLRPYAELSHARSQNKPLQTVASAGLEFTNTLDQQTSLFSNASVGYRDNHRSGAEQDAALLKASFGLNRFVNSDLTVRGRGFAEFDAPQENSNGSIMVGVNGSATYRYDSGFEIAARPWRLTGSARASYRHFSDQDQTAGKRREDIDLRIGLNHIAYLSDGLALSAKAEYKIRESTLAQFELDGLNLSLGLQYGF
ncbi:MAG: tetratricopeptide repeat protein [Pikeienuella sp.]